MQTKTYLLMTCLIFLFPVLSYTSADCNYFEVDPTCMINGETKTNSCQGWSDTSARSSPDAYEGECIGGINLLNAGQKKRIRSKILPLFDQYLLPDPSENAYRPGSLNTDGMTFVNEVYHPLLQKLIADESTLETPNEKKLAILYYLGSLIGYDYHITN